ncbi:MAG: hypothetical protein Q8L85_06295 [Alphaproteobacteria bacterium]|nr:hypothetical protein [Alphaproteobacteria bacterium]
MNKFLKKFSIYFFATFLCTLAFAALIYTENNIHDIHSWPFFSTDTENNNAPLTKLTSEGNLQHNVVVYTLNKKSEHYKHLQEIMANSSAHIILKPSDETKNNLMICKYDINVNGENHGRIKIKKEIAHENPSQKYVRFKNATINFLTLTAEKIAKKATKIGHSFERRGTHWKKNSQKYT